MSSTGDQAQADHSRPAAAGHRVTVRLLLRPKWLTARSRAATTTSGGGARWLVVAVLTIAFWWAVYAVLARVLRYLRDIPDLGPLLAGKLLGMILIGFFGILLLSNVITALSSFFLARDLDLLVGSPVPWPALYGAKLIETLINSSWMVALMAVPLIAAFGIVYSGGPLFPFVATAALAPFFLLPALLGSAVTLTLVNIFPARRTRDILSVVAVLSGAGLVTLLRLLRPERLARPEGFRTFTSYLEALQAPSAPWLPSEWTAHAIMGWLTHDRAPWPYAALWGATIVAAVIGAVLHRASFAQGFSKAQEGAGQSNRGTGQGEPMARRLVHAVLRPIGIQRRELVLKEIRVFFRDTTQWSQLLLLGVLIVLYVFNVKFLPLNGVGVTFFLRNVIPFFNMLLAGFVLASIAARFVLPGVSLEGRTLWLLRSSPLEVRDLLWAKYWVGTLPLLVLAVSIVSVTNAMLQVSDFIFAVTVFSIALLAFAVAALALCFGTVFPQFETENAAQIPTSFGGLVYMITSVALLGLVSILEARPLYIYLARHFAHAVTHPGDWWEVAGGFAAAALVCGAATLFPIRIALRRLEAVERA
jgi:ABC-2 type transport system permease protein